MDEIPNEFIIPDSVNWLFLNSSNVASASNRELFYASNKKIIAISLENGKCLKYISNKVQASVILVTSNLDFIASYSSDKTIRIYELATFTEIKEINIGECLGIKFRGNDLICAGENWCKVMSNGEVIQELEIDSFTCIETSKEAIGISTNSETHIFRFLNHYKIPEKFNAISMICDSGVYLAGVCSGFIAIFKDSAEVIRVPLKKSQAKMKNPVYSIAFLSTARVIYSTLPGDIILLNIDPLQTQSFLNNPHKKAIIAIIPTYNGAVSISMDRYICHWLVSSNDFSAPCPRTYSAPLAYTEPIWEIQTLEASPTSIALFNEKLITSCSKQSLYFYQISSVNMHSRSLYFKEVTQISGIRLNKTKEILAVLTNESVILIDLKKEKVINTIKIIAQKLEWFKENIVIASGEKITKLSLDGQIIETKNIKFEISALFVYQDFIYVGTIEGNIFVLKDSLKVFSTVHAKKITCFDYSEALLAGSDDGTGSVYWDTGTVTLERHYKAILTVSWLEEKVITGSMDHTVQIWQSRTGTPISNFRHHQGAVRVVARYTSDLVISASDDQTIRVFSTLNQTEASSPPKLKGSKKEEIVKTLFPLIHKVIYQQTRNDAYSSIVDLLNNEKKIETLIFSINCWTKEEIVSIFSIPELTLWNKIRSFSVPETGLRDLPGYLSSFSYLISEEELGKYAMRKSEKYLLKREIHKTVIWLLIAGKVDSAVELYLNHKLFIESIIICYLYDRDPVPVYTKWISRLLLTKKKEQAVKCYIALKDHKSASHLIENPETEDGSFIKSILTSKFYMC